MELLAFLHAVINVLQVLIGMEVLVFLRLYVQLVRYGTVLLVFLLTMLVLQACTGMELLAWLIVAVSLIVLLVSAGTERLVFLFVVVVNFGMVLPVFVLLANIGMDQVVFNVEMVKFGIQLLCNANVPKGFTGMVIVV